MLSPLRTRKFTRLFNCLDLDRDGHIGKADYERVSRLCALVNGFASDSHESHLLVEWFGSAWQRLQSADNTHRERVSLDQYLAIHSRFLEDRTRFQVGIAPGVEFLLTLADKNGDGLLDEQDLVRIGQSFGIDAVSVSEAHRHIDQDRDGKVSKAEILAGLEEFCFSDDPQAPGNWLLGNY